MVDLLQFKIYKIHQNLMKHLQHRVSDRSESERMKCREMWFGHTEFFGSGSGSDLTLSQIMSNVLSGLGLRPRLDLSHRVEDPDLHLTQD